MSVQDKINEAKLEIYDNKANKVLKYMLTIFMIAFVVEEFKAILEPNVIFIDNASAQVVEAAKEASKLDSSTPREEYRSEASMPSSEVEDMIRKAFPEEPAVMLAIAKSESGLNTKAGNKNRNGSIDTGLFQINSIHGYDEEWLKDPINNISAARKVYEMQGKGAWVVFQTGNYKYNL